MTTMKVTIKPDHTERIQKAMGNIIISFAELVIAIKDAEQAYNELTEVLNNHDNTRNDRP